MDMQQEKDFIIENGVLKDYVGIGGDIVIPAGVTTIGKSAFVNCSNLTCVILPPGVTEIESYAFRNCSSLSKVFFPKELTRIEDYAFESCPALISISLPENVNYIGYKAFSYSPKLVEVINHSCLALSVGSTEHGGIARYAMEVHAEESKLVQDERGFVFYPDGDMYWLVDYAGDETMLILPDNCCGKNYRIRARAFDKKKMFTVTIPAGVTAVDESAFDWCSKLVEIVNQSDCPLTTDNVRTHALEIHTGESKLFKDDQGYVFYPKDELCYLINYEGFETELQLPKDCCGKQYSIHTYAFADRRDLCKITVSEGVTDIGYGAFEGCSSLIDISLPDSVTKLGNSVFKCCTALTNVTLPAHITELPSFLFSSCSSLTTIHIPDGVTRIQSFAFEGCSALTDVTIPDGTIAIGTNAFSGCSSLTNMIIPAGVTEIESCAFADCLSLDTVTILGTVKKFDERAFSNSSPKILIKGIQGLPSQIRNLAIMGFLSCHEQGNVIIQNAEEYKKYIKRYYKQWIKESEIDPLMLFTYLTVEQMIPAKEVDQYIGSKTPAPIKKMLKKYKEQLGSLATVRTKAKTK